MTFPIPQLKIRQDYALLGFDADLGTQSIEQPPATIEMRQPRADLQIEHSLGHFEINQDRAWDALALGNNLKTMSKIYSMAPDIALTGIARIVEDGNRLAAIHLGGNPIADMAMDWQRTFPEFDFRGEASYDNVDLEYIPGNLQINATPKPVELQVRVNPPVHNYERGKLEFSMLKYNKVEFTPPPFYDVRA